MAISMIKPKLIEFCNRVKQNLFWAFAYDTALIHVAAGVLYLIFGQSSTPEGLRFPLLMYFFKVKNINDYIIAGIDLSDNI